MLDHFLSFKGEPNKIKNKVVENNLYLIAHNGSGFDRSVVLSNLPQWRSVVKLIKNGAGIFSFKLFNGFVDAEKKWNMMKIMKILGKKKENEWLPYVKNDVLSTAFCYARYTIGR